MRLLLQIGMVAVGSACGGLARWGVGSVAGRWLGSAWPFGTFFINIVGSLFLGWFLTAVSERLVDHEITWLRADDLRLAIGVGFTGAFTTFSSFEWEAHGLFGDGKGWAATLYLVASVIAGLLAVRAGVLLARVI